MIKVIILVLITCIPLFCYSDLFLNKMRDNIIKYGRLKWNDVFNCIGLFCLMITIGTVLVQYILTLN